MAFDPTAFSQATNFLNNFTNSQKHEILTVSSLQQVKDFTINRGDSYLMLDPNADRLYVKEKDNIGKDSIRIFSLTEITEQYLNSETPVTMTKADYNNLIQRIERLEGKNATEKPEQSKLDFKSK